MADLDKTKLIVVCGPTATGKSGLAVKLAKKYGGEIISADSMQIYKGLVIGTAAATDTDGIPQHLVGFLSPKERFSTADWQEKAKEIIKDITARGFVPIICGGTGLYISSLLQGLSFEKEDTNEELRKELSNEWENCGGKAMLEKLAKHDPQRAAQLHENDKKRVLRALEQSIITGLSAQQRNELSKQYPSSYDALVLGLNYKDRSSLYAAIEKRVDVMMQDDLMSEAKMVWENKDTYKTAVQAIGYKEFFPYFEGVQSQEDCVEKLKQATRNYAKRQVTWFSKMQEIHWFCPQSDGMQEELYALCASFL